MSESTDDPYRETALAVARPIAPARTSDKARWVVWGLAVGGGAGAIALGAAFGPALIGAAFYGTIVDLVRTTAQRRQMLKALQTRPYPVTFDRASAAEPSAITASPIHDVVVTLARPLDGPAAERWATSATTAAPGLSVMMRDDAVVLGAWPWGTRDVFLLAHLLAAWGDALHAEAGIAGVAVTWARGGPPLAL